MANEHKDAIRNIQPFVSRMPHAAASGDRRLLNGNGTLSRPAVNPNEKHIVVGTESSNEPQTMFLVDTQAMEQRMLADPVVSRTQLSKGIITSQWISHDRLLVCAGTKEEAPSSLQMYSVNVDGNGEFKLQETKDVLEAIREIATNKLQPNLGIYGGTENKLNLCDFNVNFQPTRSFLTDSGVSSVRWSQFREGKVLSCTTEEGKLSLYDVNAPGDNPTWTYQGDLRIHKALYSHCQTSEFQILLGYEDNFMQAIDIRFPQQGLINHMTGTFDPFCHMIGDMHYREASGYLLVTGVADYSVYKHHRSGPQNTIAQLWCHSFGSGNTYKNDSGAIFQGVFLKDNWVVCTQDATLSLVKLE